jgi:hypothetical protein
MIIEQFDGKTGFSLNDIEEYDEYETDVEYDTDAESDDESTNMLMNIDLVEKLYNERYEPSNFQYNAQHPTIRNYHYIISRPNYIKKEIAQCIELPTLERIAIIKTLWIKLIQRKWKKVFKQRQQIMKTRMRPYSLYNREITGKWESNCVKLPGLKGMLSDLTA